MTYSYDDYDPPLEGHIDTRQLALFADNHGMEWVFDSYTLDQIVRVVVTLDGAAFTADAADPQSAFNLATEKAMASKDINRPKNDG